jgi:hypothetical protein
MVQRTGGTIVLMSNRYFFTSRFIDQLFGFINTFYEVWV